MRRLISPLVVAVVAGCAVVPQPADLVLTGGVVWTGAVGAPTGQAVAIRNGRIVRVGTDDEVRSFVGPATREIKLGGRLVVPGFIDDHTHFISGGFQLGSVDLRDASSPREFTARIARFVRQAPTGRWVTGGDWDHERWAGGVLPRHEWIDSVTKETPVFVTRLDGHMGLANRKAMQLAGITKATKDPVGGTIVRDARTGEPTGVLKDGAMDLVTTLIKVSNAEYDDAFRRAQAHALSLGVTMIEDMGGNGWDDFETFRRARDSGELKLRVYSFVPLSSWERLRDYVARNGTGDSRLRWGGLKGFVDGSLGSTTAWFFQPFTDAPKTSGLMVTDTAKMREWILGADKAHLHVAVHAIGDRANDWILNTYEWVAEQNGKRDRRFRIEHAQHLLRNDVGRFAQLGVLPSMQPYHAIDDGRWAEKRIGPERIKTTYAFRSLLKGGARLMFGSDWTVAPLDPLLGIYAAVTRRTLDGRYPTGWQPQEKVTVQDALRAYTANNAYGAFMERELGSLEQGKRADLVVLSQNILKMDPTRIPEARVDYTVIGGEIVYVRPQQAGVGPASGPLAVDAH
ncbi:MAG TPA: amidohydrolase [Longimicrobiales bacterium]|nr:amidohydrolase [Longimicrobiales bacterium]